MEIRKLIRLLFSALQLLLSLAPKTHRSFVQLNGYIIICDCVVDMMMVGQTGSYTLLCYAMEVELL